MSNDDQVKITPMDYSEERPEAENPLKVMDLSFRDGQQSLFISRGRTEDMIPVAEKMDEIGFWAVEAWGGATFEVMHSALNEDPWERIRTLKRYFKKTPLAMVLRAQTLVGHRNYADDVARAFVDSAATNGIDIFRIFDALNDFRNFEVVVDVIKSCKKHFQGCICYSLTEPRMGGDVYNLEYYINMAKELEKMGADSICLKDMAGLMAPYDGYALIKALKDEISIPIHLHSHFTTGMASMTHLKAIEAGVDIIDTCLSSYAYRTSHPAVEPLVMTLLGTNRDTGFDIKKLALISEILENDILPKYRHLIDDTRLSIIDTDVLLHQVPASMISSITSKLKEMDAPDKIEKVFEEMPKVRQDLGQIPLVTPTHQIIGTQAINNVLFDEGNGRYKMVADQVKDLCYGLYGTTPAPVDREVQQKALKGYSKGETPISGRPGEALEDEMEKAKEDVKDLASGLEDELLYALFPVTGKRFLKWKYGMEEPPEDVKPKTLENAKAELALIARVKAGKPIEKIGKEIPDKGENLRTFNVFVDDDFFEVGVDEIGGPPAASYIRQMPVQPSIPQSVPAAPAATVQPKSPAPSPAAPVPAQQPVSPPAETAPKVKTEVDGGVPLTAPMPGTIVSYEKQVGDAVSEGETIVILEAMKMENALPAPGSGVIKTINYKAGDSVAKGDVLCVIE